MRLSIQFVKDGFTVEDGCQGGNRDKINKGKCVKLGKDGQHGKRVSTNKV